MWCLSKGSQSTKLRQSTRNQGSSTTRLQSCQNRQQKPKSHNKGHRRLQYRNTQIRIQIRKNQKRSTLKSYCKNPRRRSQRPAKRQADQHKGHQDDQAKGPSPPRNFKTKSSTKNHEFAWQRLHGTSIPTTRTNQQQCRRPSIIPHAESSGREQYKTKSTCSSRIIHGISFHAPEIAKSSPTNSHSGTKRTNAHESSD